MKLLINQRGYALVIVLLMIVLFLGVSATFMAGSLNNATQERKIDTSNQAVAAAEMGVIYYTEDFNRALERLKTEILIEINSELAIIAACKINCDKDATSKLNTSMKNKYKDRIVAKVNQIKTVPPLKYASNDGKINYQIESASSVERADKIEVTLKLIGKSTQGEANSDSKLTVSFDIEIPSSFLTTTISSTYQDVYKNDPQISCSDLVRKAAEGKAGQPLYDCKLDEDINLRELISLIDAKGLNPSDFRVFTNDYYNDVCDTTEDKKNKKNNNGNCNAKNLSGVNVVITSSLADVKNMNQLSNFNLFVKGTLDAKNMNGLDNTVLIVQELIGGNNINNMENSTIVVLGFEGSQGIENKAHFDVGNNVKTKKNAKICVDLDRVRKDDLFTLSSQISLDAESSLFFYYTSNTDTGLVTNYLAKERFYPKTDYPQFLKDCGITAASSHTVPNVQDKEFDFEVDY